MGRDVIAETAAMLASFDKPGIIAIFDMSGSSCFNEAPPLVLITTRAKRALAAAASRSMRILPQSNHFAVVKSEQGKSRTFGINKQHIQYGTLVF